MSFDPSILLLTLVTSGAGFVLFTYGRKQARVPQIVGGILYMAYPYFVTALIPFVLTGIVIGVAVWMALRMGW